MVLDFKKYKTKRNEAQSRATELNDYVLEKCNHSEAMTSFVEDPDFQKELVKTISENKKTDV